MATPQRSLMMEIEIKFGKGRSDRVKVHYDDDADQLADEFVRRHKLKETSKPVIAQYISSTMENFLSQPRRLTKEKRPENHVVPSATESTPLGPASADATARFSPMPQSTKSDFFPPENVRTPPLPGSSRLSRPSSFLTSNSELGDPAAGVDKTDLLSQISRSLSMSMDYKQYQESVDRRMSMKNFSLKDIASEVAVLTKETSEGGLSVDSDTSTVQAVKPQSTSIYEAPSLPDRNADNDNTWGAYSGIGYGANDRRSSGRYAPLNKETIDDLSNGNYSSLDNWPDISPKSRSHLGSRDSTSHFVGDAHSEARDELMTVSDMAADEDRSESSEGPSAEEMYNRLKMNSNPSALQPNNAYSRSGWPAANRVLKPSGSTMQLGLHKSSLSSNQASTSAKIDNKSLVGKSANERLYNAAQLDRDKKSRRAKIANDQEIRELEQGKFKLNRNSQKIVANLRPKGYQNVHIGERLHVEGVVEKQLKNKRSEELQGKLTPEEWSCAKCGTFQTIVKTSIVIQPLHQMQSKSHISNNTSDSAENGKSSKPVMICKECGWNQSAVEAHRPVNIALMMNEDPDELLRGRWQGNGPVAEEGGIHQYLYENARTRENIQQLNRVLWNEAHSGLTFAPSLPETSKEILGKYKTSTTASSSAKTMSSLGSSSGFSENEVDSPPPPAPVGLNKDGKNIIAGPAIGTYLSKSATERLSTTQTRPVLSNIPRHSDSRNETESQVNSFKHADQSQFVNRLVYEYKDKQERRQKQVEFSSKHDINTGDRLFQPKVGPDPEETLGFGATTVREKANGPKRNVFEEIMLKDKLLKQKRKEAEDKAVAQTMKDLNEKQVKALDTSHQILQQSTQNNIEELFQVLLEAQQHIIQDSNASSGRSDEPEWKTYLVDLDMVNTEMMIAEVGLLLNEVRAYKLSQLQHAAHRNSENTDGAESSNMLVSFASFKDLIVKCMKRRDGTGRSYVYVPKKKADVTMQMIQNNLKEETFRPTIDKNSAIMSLRRHKELSDYPIEDVLQVEGERIRSKWENARQARILQDSRELTFKPKLFKPPSYVKPKYWGMEETTPASDSEGDPEGDSPQLSSQPDLRAAGNLTMESEDQSPPLDASSVVSSEAGQVLQMPALQTRPQTISGSYGAKTTIPLPSKAFVEAWSGGYGDQALRSPPTTDDAAISPVRREHEHSPGSKSSDVHSINTISTTFTTDEQGRLSSPVAAATRSVSSGVPLVSRRYTSSLSKTSLPSSSAQNSSVMSSKSNSSITRKAVVVNKPPRSNTSGKAETQPPALPLLPHELQQRNAPGNSAKHSGWKSGRVSDASELQPALN